MIEEDLKKKANEDEKVELKKSKMRKILTEENLMLITAKETGQANFSPNESMVARMNQFTVTPS